jgi:inhibitor of growth protein 3
MPRDDLSIDFVKRMPLSEALDPALILDEWINRVSNLPEEIRFIQDEIADKDRQYAECVRIIEERDARIQKWIKANGSHEPNPREEGYRQTIRENFAQADALAADKIALTQKLLAIMDKHVRHLDVQIKILYDRNEPGFTDPDELPSLLRATAANHATPPVRSINPSANPVTAALNPLVNNASQVAIRAANPQIRSTQLQQHHSASAPATPAASMLLNRTARENSAGPGSGAPKRGPRSNSGLGSAPVASSGLARHSSLGPGTPKAHPVALGPQRAGSAGPRASTKGTTAGAGRKAGTPSSGVGRKKGTPAAGPTKSGLSRVKRAARNSPSTTTAESELSEANSGSEADSEGQSRGRGTPAAAAAAAAAVAVVAARAGSSAVASQKDNSQSQEPAAGVGGVGGGGGGGGGRGSSQAKDPPTATAAASVDDEEDDEEEDAEGMEVDAEEDDEAGDDKKYCLCQNVSFGDMVACDNDACPYEWFHWSCVGLKSEPNGTWYCPVCAENMKKGNKGK